MTDMSSARSDQIDLIAIFERALTTSLRRYVSMSGIARCHQRFSKFLETLKSSYAKHSIVSCPSGTTPKDFPVSGTTTHMVFSSLEL